MIRVTAEWAAAVYNVAREVLIISTSRGQHVSARER